MSDVHRILNSPQFKSEKSYWVDADLVANEVVDSKLKKMDFGKRWRNG